jgi:hypothetical protein
MSTFPKLPDYFALRVAADLSSGIRGQTVGFDYGTDGLEVPAPAGPPPAPVSVSTPLLARARPMVRQVTIAVTGYGDCVLPAHTCSAMLWSESAVEKFLLPYYVSAGGQKAHQVLHAINHAWYNYDKNTPVVALAFGYPSTLLPARSMELWDTVSVIYGEQGRLQVAPLLQFLGSQKRAPTTHAPEYVPCRWEPAPEAPSTAFTAIDSVGAREVAEYVSGWRDQPVYVYAQEGGGGLEPRLTLDGPPLFTALTRTVRPDRPKVENVTLTYTAEDGTQNRELSAIGGLAGNAADSAFWTDAAIELLVTPYYASVEGDGAPWYLAVILGKWSGVIPASHTEAVELLEQILKMLGKLLIEKPASEEGETEETGPFTSQVFALVHLPDSEWVDQANEPAPPGILLENRTWLLGPEGEHPLVSPRRRLVPRRRLTA